MMVDVTGAGSDTASVAEVRRARRSPSAFSPIVVTPTFNHAGSLIDVLERLDRLDLPIIVVNDGSTDDTARRLAEWTSTKRRVPVQVVSHARNRGKADALRTAFQAAKEGGYTHAVTIDSDGQHLPEDIPKLLAAARARPGALVIGARALDLRHCPRSNVLGWWVTALGIWLETGRRVLDNQCGLRVYPLRLFDVVRGRASRFGLESELVTRAAWAGCPIVETPVACYYPPAGERISHLKLHRDPVMQFLMHAGLTIRRLIPWPHRTLHDPNAATHEAHPAPSGWDWLNPLVLWRNLRKDRFEQLLIAAAMGIGSFMSAMPLNGWQILLGVYASKRLRLHLIPTLFGALLCLTPIGEFQRASAIAIGYSLFHLSWPDMNVLNPDRVGHWTLLANIPVAWGFGSVAVGFLSNWIVIPTLVHLFKLIPVHAESEAVAAKGAACT